MCIKGDLGFGPEVLAGMGLLSTQMGIQAGLLQGPSTGQLGLTLGDWASGPRSFQDKNESGPLELAGSLRVNLDHDVEKHFRKIRFGGKWGKHFISWYTFANHTFANLKS